jgi:hypothetical protein
MTDEEYEKNVLDANIRDAKTTLGDANSPVVILFVRNVSKTDIDKLAASAHALLPSGVTYTIDKQRPGVSTKEMSERCLTWTIPQSEIDEEIAWAKKILTENGIELPQTHPRTAPGATDLGPSIPPPPPPPPA